MDEKLLTFIQKNRRAFGHGHERCGCQRFSPSLGGEGSMPQLSGSRRRKDGVFT